MRIALDVMGGDHAPEVVVDGGVQAAREFGHEIILVGKEEVTRTELAKYDTGGLTLPVAHASQVIEMDVEPAAEKPSARSSAGAGSSSASKANGDTPVSSPKNGADDAPRAGA